MSKTNIVPVELYEIAADTVAGKNAPKAERQTTTDEIKAFLRAYPTLQERIDKTEARIAFLDMCMGSPSASNMSGMPSGSRDRSSKQERDYIKKEELEERLGVMYAEENRLREEIEAVIERMEKPKEQSVIEMHYLDGAVWRDVSIALFGEEPDYDDNEQRYLKKTFKIHGSALQSFARIYDTQKGEGGQRNVI